MAQLIVLGATGSIGRSTADVLRHLKPGTVTIDGLAAHRNGEELWRLGREFHARWVGLADSSAGHALAGAHRGEAGPVILVGWDAILAEGIGRAPAGTRVLGAMSGFAGLAPTLAAVERGMDVLLANKETLVAAGELVMGRARASGSRIIPVDSEHSALWQCLALPQPFRRLILTCSGGPFRGWTRERLADATPQEALRHPNWEMGAKITIDSATLMNKGLEIIEAHWLFGVSYDRIDVVIHPQSVIHSMVEFVDGATMAQLGWPDMRVPIQVALSWPERWPLDTPPLDLAGKQLSFEPVDATSFPAPQTARRAGEAKGLYPTVLNAANEVAVAAFLAGSLPFLGIMEVIASTLDRWSDHGSADDLGAVLDADRLARVRAREMAAKYRI